MGGLGGPSRKPVSFQCLHRSLMLWVENKCICLRGSVMRKSVDPEDREIGNTLGTFNGTTLHIIQLYAISLSWEAVLIEV